jgi:hypothetical protein
VGWGQPGDVYGPTQANGTLASERKSASSVCLLGFSTSTNMVNILECSIEHTLFGVLSRLLSSLVSRLVYSTNR